MWYEDWVMPSSLMKLGAPCKVEPVDQQRMHNSKGARCIQHERLGNPHLQILQLGYLSSTKLILSLRPRLAELAGILSL